MPRAPAHPYAESPDNTFTSPESSGGKRTPTIGMLREQVAESEKTVTAVVRVKDAEIARLKADLKAATEREKTAVSLKELDMRREFENDRKTAFKEGAKSVIDNLKELKGLIQ